MLNQSHPASLDGCIVLPFQPMAGQTYDGLGLAIHFLLGNVMALHSGIKELWFGWRVKQIYEDGAHFAAYCRGICPTMALKDLAEREKVRFWVYGRYDHHRIEVTVYDALRIQAGKRGKLSFSSTHHLVKFRQSFLSLFHQMDFAFPDTQVRAALWEEDISSTGLKTVGRALEKFYRSSAFHPKDRMDLIPFELAVAEAPKAFMAHDLMGWAYHYRKDYDRADKAFQNALTVNPLGVGAMAGMMWCGIHMNDMEKALSWAVRKAEICHQDVTLAEEKALRLFRKYQ